MAPKVLPECPCPIVILLNPRWSNANFQQDMRDELNCVVFASEMRMSADGNRIYLATATHRFGLIYHYDETRKEHVLPNFLPV